MVSLRRSCIEHGLEHELIYVTYYSVQVEIWRGNFTEAPLLTEQGMESALQLGGEVSIGAALTMRAALAAYAGNEQQVRRDVGAALAAMQRCGAIPHMLEGWPIAIAGFLEVSLGNHEAALDTWNRCCRICRRLRKAPRSTPRSSFPTPLRRWFIWAGSTRPSRSSRRWNVTAVDSTAHGCWRSALAVEACFWPLTAMSSGPAARRDGDGRTRAAADAL